MLKNKLVLLISLAVTLATTAGAYAFTFTTVTSTIGVANAANDYGAITSNMTISSYQPFGRQRGSIGSGTLFNVTPTANWTGDLEVIVTLANPEELVKNYRSWNLRLKLTNSGGTSVDAQGIAQLISLDQPVASFYFPATNFTGGTTYFVRNDGGSYVALPWIGSGWASTYQPLIFAQVTQAQ